ncbi:hypothetical protein ACRALDRAFT_1063132 [Sodiomyces alcalophilus JCM 7366]|uniref:uncharacterized protein n=1 Tax=Sodiomyces alcalophilus JCM 7366 TaxID=591952 RepID=UPI0039B3ADEF
MPSQGSAGGISLLDDDYRRCFERALMRILQAEVAEETYAEILDGIPTAASFREFTFSYQGHPSMDHPEIDPGALARAREFRLAFDATSVELPRTTVLAYQRTVFGSKAFQLRLLELLARACHQIAVYLFQVGERNHHHGEHERWRDEPREKNPWDWYRPPIAFSHGSYNAFDQYPNGIADVAGYWAEAKIFGGVVVFDRGETETECRDVFIHACRRGSPKTIFPPTQEQYDQLMKLLLGDDDDGDDGGVDNENHDDKASDGGRSRVPSLPRRPCPLPILPTSQNRWRWHAWDAFARFHIFRDRYERRVGETKPREGNRRAVDWPEIQDQLFVAAAMGDRMDGRPVDEEEVAAARKRMKMITPSSPLWKSEMAGSPVYYMHMRDPSTGDFAVKNLAETD